MTRRLGRLVLTGVMAVLLAVPTAGALTAPAQAKRAEPAPHFRVMTLNIKVTLPPARWAGDAARAITMTDILAMQEGSQADDREAMAAMMHSRGWDVWYPTTGGTENPVAWNAAKFYLISAESVFVHAGEPGVTPARYINTVVLGDIATNQQVAIVNTHTINKGAVDAGLKPNKRTDRLKKHLRMLRDKIVEMSKVTSNVVATGDLNVNYMRDRNLKVPGLPTSVLGPVVDFVMPVGQTYNHGKTQLDYVMALKGGGLSAVNGQIVPGFASDHRGVVVGFVYGGEVPPPGTQPLPASNARFAPGVITNRPRAHSSAKRRAVLKEMRRVIKNAPTGSAIHIASAHVTDKPVRKAIIAAHKRHVYVQVLVRQKKLTKGEKKLRTLLGTNTSLRTWFTGCSSAQCRRTAKSMAATTLLVSQAGQTRAVKVLSNRPLTKAASRKPSRAKTTTSLAKYNRGFHKYFDLIA